ncbi:MAG: ABC transporter permease [Mollicutes bacterium PWAP]|nr:ABC transporter permease [Mollicutes bacterium PWAP]
MNTNSFEKQYDLININKNWFNQISKEEYIEKSSKKTLSGKPTKIWKDILKRFFTNKWNIIFLSIFVGLIILIAIGSTFSKFDSTHSVSNSPSNQIRFLHPKSSLNTIGGAQLNIIKSIIPGSHLSSSGNSIVDNNGFITSSNWNGHSWTIDYKNPYHVNTLLGTDDTGRSVWERLISSSRFSFGLAISVASIETLLGTIIGIYLGYKAGTWIDTYILRFFELIYSIPSLLLIIIFVLILGTGFISFMISLILIGFISPIFIARMFTMKIKDQEFIKASISIGASTNRIIYRHILPQIFGKLLVSFVQRIPQVVFLEATIVFLGMHLGGESQNTLGTMMESARKISALTSNILYLLAPATVLLLFTLSLQLIANGLRDAFDAKTLG